MIIYIIVCIVVFAFIVVALNFESIKGKIKELFKSKKDKTPSEKIEPVQVKEKKTINPNLSYDENENKVVIDNIKRIEPEKQEKSEKEIQSTPFLVLKENEEDELENKNDKGGRKKEKVEKTSNLEVEVEDLGEFEVAEPDSLADDVAVEEFNDYDLDDDKVNLKEEIKNMSPEMKAILIGDILKKKQ